MQMRYDVANCQCEGCFYRTPSMTYYDHIKNMNAEKLAEMSAQFVWKTICKCDQSQQIKCERYGMPEGGCVQCIKKMLKNGLKAR